MHQRPTLLYCQRTHLMTMLLLLLMMMMMYHRIGYSNIGTVNPTAPLCLCVSSVLGYYLRVARYSYLLYKNRRALKSLILVMFFVQSVYCAETLIT